MLALTRLEEQVVIVFAELLTAQGSAFIVVFIALKLLKEAVRLDKIGVRDSHSAWSRRWNWVRFLVVSFGLIVFTGWFTTWFLLPYLGTYRVVNLPATFLPLNEISLPLMTALSVSVAVAAIFYTPPEHRNIEKSLFTWRLLLLVISVGLTVWAYSLFSSVDHFSLVTATAFGLSTILVFVQKALS